MRTLTRRQQRPRNVHAAIAVIERRDRYLIAQRLPGDIRGGYWEFPGGTREAGESWSTCLRRELHEELGVSIATLTPFGTTRLHDARGVLHLEVYRCTIAGRPRPLAAQALRWVRSDQLDAYRFPPANRRIIARLKRYEHTHALPASPRTRSSD